MDKAQQEIWFVGVDFHITATDRKDLIFRKLSQGVKVKFLVFDPSSNLLDTLGRDFDQNPAEIQSECSQSIASIVDLNDEWMQQQAYSRYPDGLEVRLFRDIRIARFYLIDPDNPKAQSYYVPYMNHMNSPAVPGFLMRNINGGVIEEFVPGIRKLWMLSQPLADYLVAHPSLPAKPS